MKICLVIEGAYPYVQGGVSSWVNALITRMPEHEFILQTIIASPATCGDYKYDLPPNVVAVCECVLQTEAKKRGKPPRLTPQATDALRALVFGTSVCWEALFDLFRRPFCIDALLMGAPFYNLVQERYAAFPNEAFTPFVWAFRSLLKPLLTALQQSAAVPVADVYHAVSTGYAGVVAAQAGYLHNKPVLLTEHGIYTREREEEIIRASWAKGTEKDFWIQQYYQLSRCVYDRAAKVVAISQHSQRMQAEIGCPAGKICVVPNGVPCDLYQSLPGKVPQDAGYINLCAMARVTPIKDIRTLITAFSFAKAVVPNLRLFIMGSTQEDPSYFRDCQDLTTQLNVADVVFTGHVPVRDYLGRMDMVILTSISEGQPLSLMEAMAAGKPCMATRVGCGAEILQAESTCPAGLVVSALNVGDITKAIVCLAQDKVRCAQMGENGRRIAQTLYQESGYVAAYRGIYDALNAQEKRGMRE